MQGGTQQQVRLGDQSGPGRTQGFLSPGHLGLTSGVIAPVLEAAQPCEEELKDGPPVTGHPEVVVSKDAAHPGY